VERAPGASGGSEIKDIPVEVKDNGDGTYSVRYDPPVAGKYRINVTVPDNQSIRDMPKIVPCFFPADPSKCFATGRGWKEAWDYLPAKFTVHVKDVNGNPVPGELVRIVFKNVTPGAKRAELEKELGKLDNYLQKERLIKLLKCKLR